MRGHRAVLFLVTLSASACAQPSVSPLPIQSSENGELYKFEGGASTEKELAEADRKINDYCKSVNGGTPMVVYWRKQPIRESDKPVSLADLLSPMQGSATTTAATGGYKQEMLYKCKRQERDSTSVGDTSWTSQVIANRKASVSPSEWSAAPQTYRVLDLPPARK
jgi:hypothetical protein